MNGNVIAGAGFDGSWQSVFVLFVSVRDFRERMQQLKRPHVHPHPLFNIRLIAINPDQHMSPIVDELLLFRQPYGIRLLSNDKISKMMEAARKVSKNNIQQFLENYYHKPIRVIQYSKIGSGWVANGYKVQFLLDGEIKQVALRTLSPINLSHDYSSDRAAYFLIQHHSANKLPHHIKSLGVFGVSRDSKEIGVIDRYHEFFQVLEWARGEEYGHDLERILKSGEATGQDIDRAVVLSGYLALIHRRKVRYSKERTLSLYKRHSRDFVGSSFLMDVLDIYPSKVVHSTKDSIHLLVNNIYKYRERLKNQSSRLRKIHGDFHPGNIRFVESNKFVVLDASRAIWGEPADDVASLGINYIWYAIRQTGKFEGDFKKLFEAFWENYLKKTNDKEISKFMPLFLAVRSVVLNHPSFFPVTDSIRRKMVNLSTGFINAKDFNPKYINKFLS